VARIIARLLKLAGKYVGLACSEGLYFDRRLVDKRNCATWGSAQKVLLNRSVEAAVIENSFATILSEGLGYDRCQVGVVTNIDAGRHFGEYYIENEEQVCNVLRTQVDVVLSGGVAVLNAADSLVAEMAKYCDGEVIFFSIDGQLGSIADHLGKGGRAVLMRDGHLVLKQGEQEMVLLKLAPVLGAECNWQLENVLAAVAAAWALGISTDIVRAGIATFEVERALPNNTRKYS
jgi:cyanophycin synthetase